MLKILTTQELIRALETVSQSVASTLLHDPTEHYLKQVRDENQVLRSDDPITVAFRQGFSAFGPTLLVKEAFELCSTIPIFCSPRPICNAVARKTHEGIPFVLVFDGLLAMLSFWQIASILVRNVQEQLRRGRLVNISAEAFEAMSFDASSLLYWSQMGHGGIKLPREFEILSGAHRKLAISGFNSSIVFTVMHEIGHCILGHLDSKTPPSAQVYSGFSHEDIDKWKSMEFEADSLAFNCFKPEIRVYQVAGVMFLLDAITELESLCFPYSASHPLPINRLRNLSIGLDPESEAEFAQYTEQFIQSRTGLLDARREKLPDEAKFTYLIDRKSVLEKIKAIIPSAEEGAEAFNKLRSLYDGVDY